MGGVFVLCNMTIGLGVLSMPYAFKLAGGPMMIVVMLFAGGLCMYSAYLIHKALELAKPLAKSALDWGYLAELAFGKLGRSTAEVCFRGELVAYTISYICTLGVHVHLLFPSVSIQQGVIICSFGTLFMSYLPVSLIAKVSALGHLAYAVVAACLYYSEYASMKHPQAPVLTELVGDNWNKVRMADAWSNIPIVFEICVFAWACHGIVPAVATSMARPSQVKQVILIGFPVSIAACMVIGLSCYLILGPYTKQVFTDNLAEVYWLKPEGDVLEGLSWIRMTAALSVTIKLAATIPVTLSPLLTSIEAGIQHPTTRCICRLSLISAMGTVAAVFRSQVVLLVALVGATLGNMLIFILPCVVYYGIKRRVSRVSAAEACLLLAIIVLGTTSMVYSVCDCLRKLMHSDQDRGQLEL